MLNDPWMRLVTLETHHRDHGSLFQFAEVATGLLKTSQWLRIQFLVHSFFYEVLPPQKKVFANT